jgi:hypothetical protein
MSLEQAKTIAQLQTNNPTPQDPINQGDDQLRLIKKVLQLQFPGVTGTGFSTAITATEDEINYLSGVTGPIQAQLGGSVPIGGIVMWTGATAPQKWRICDGTNGTPDLRNRFIVGASTAHPMGIVGGQADAVVVAHAHTANSTGSINLATGGALSNHTHNFTTSPADVNHTHGYTVTNTSSQGASSLGGGIAVGKASIMTDGMSAGSNNPHVHSGTTLAENSIHTHGVAGAVTVTTGILVEGVLGTNANLPPYYALAYIMRYL